VFALKKLQLDLVGILSFPTVYPKLVLKEGKELVWKFYVTYAFRDTSIPSTWQFDSSTI